MTQSLFIPGPLPGLNEILNAMKRRFRSGKTAYGVLKEEWQQTIFLVLRQHRIVPVQKPARLTFQWYERDRRRDADNISGGGRKIVLDSLVKAQILVNDSPRYVVGLADTFHLNKHAPGVQVTIEEV